MSRSLKKGPYINVSLEKKILAMNESGKHFPSLHSSCQRLGLRIILNFMKYLLACSGSPRRHPADTNNDHLQTSMACQEAIRLFQRRPEVKRVKEFWYMEVPSCTEWKINNAMKCFEPNCFVEVGKDGVDAKIKALGMYRGVMRPYPHPRSAEYITGLAAVTGGQWGVNYAEAFEVVQREY